MLTIESMHTIAQRKLNNCHALLREANDWEREGFPSRARSCREQAMEYGILATKAFSFAQKRAEVDKKMEHEAKKGNND